MPAFKARLSIVGQDASFLLPITEMPILPKIDDPIGIEEETLYVRTIVFYPLEEDYDVYIVIGPKRPI